MQNMILVSLRLKSGMEAILIASSREGLQEKIEMDQSYEKSADESGVYSNDSKNSGNSSWVFWANEIADPETFDPPILQSSNLLGNENAISCNWSSIGTSGLQGKCIGYSLKR